MEFPEESTTGQPPENLVDKILVNTDANEAKKIVSDLVVFGDVDTFKLICEISSESAGWMKTTKAMYVGHGCVVQVTTQLRSQDGANFVAEALTYVPGVIIHERKAPDGSDVVINRWIAPA